MFTGIVQGTGRVAALRRRGGGARLLVRSGRLLRGARRGESVAVNGVCLTVAGGVPARGRSVPGAASFDLVAETLERTTLSALRPGRCVNLERALRYGDSLGGHWVTGHVDGVGRVGVVRDRTSGAPPRPRLRRAPPAPPGGREVTIETALPLPVPGMIRGSVAVDGVSLTVAAAGRGWFRVALIPETIRRTTLGGLGTGDAVNIELDRGRKGVPGEPGRVTWGLLRRCGYR